MPVVEIDEEIGEEIGEDLRKLCVVRVRMDVEEKAQLFALSKEGGLKASQWLRVRIVEAWKKRGGEPQTKKSATCPSPPLVSCQISTHSPVY